VFFNFSTDYKPFNIVTISNLTNNRLNITATAAQITTVKTTAQSINTNLPFLIGLTTAKRSSLPAINLNT
jgi:hypothetical protein